MNLRKLYEWIRDGGRLPRKVKRAYLNRKVTKSRLKIMLSETVVGVPIKTMYEQVEFTPHGAFCPKCGETKYRGGNQTSYPEHWEYFKCMRCKSVVGYIDNSPFIHALECKDDKYNPVF